jgi:lipopolysaccharide/colanic/teichoic acid biosynthesis glycosyltransferase
MRAFIDSLRGRKHFPEPFVSAEAIRETLSRERMRIDRRGGVVCLLTFEIPESQASRKYLERLADVFKRRLRNSDLAGIIDPHQVGVVLPDTPRSGADKLAADILQATRFQVGDLKYRIAEYSRADEDSNVKSTGQRVSAPILVPADVMLARLPTEAVFCAPIPRWKRAMDIAGGLFGLLAFSPVLVLAGLLVKLSSRGPVFFVQKREGRGGRVFRMFKFRTMRVGAEQQQPRLRQYSEQDGPAFKMTNDPRLTSVGAFLRKTSIDELPQLLNVLRGEMSLVGPRPLPDFESAQCTGWQRRRLHVNPGLTCIWQVQGRSSVSFVEWVRMDLDYVRNMSFLLDVKLLIQTVPVLFGHRGAI